MKSKIIFFMLTISLGACQKDSGQGKIISQPNIFELIKSIVDVDPVALISVTGEQYVQDETSFNLSISAKLDENLGGVNSIESLNFEKFSLNPKIDLGGTLSCQYSSLENNDKIVPNQLFGNEVPISFKTKTGISGSFESSFKLPNNLKLRINNGVSPTNVSKSKGIEITWNEDSNNGLPLFLNVMYNKAFSQKNKREALPNNLIQVAKQIADNGKFVVTAQDLKDFPVDGSVAIELIRGSYKLVNIENRKAVLFAKSIAHSMPIMVVE
jgi:hypothetical protein